MISADADRAALQMSGTNAVGSNTVPCSDQQTRERVQVHVQGEDEKGLAGVAVTLQRSSGQVLRGQTDTDGNCTFTGLDTGDYTVSLPDLDRDAWQALRTEQLGGDRFSANPAPWQAAMPPDVGQDQVHIAVQGECVAKLAARHGFFPESLWLLPANSSLRQRRDSLYVLMPGDPVAIPARRLASAPVAASARLVVRRLGIPEYLHIRLLDAADVPRIGVRYLVAIQVENGTVMPDVPGETDGEGFVSVPIPPGATLATISLDAALDLPPITARIGHIDPIDSISGWQERLNNLGFDCGPADGIAGEKTAEAIAAFQRKRNLPASGAINQDTRAALLQLTLT